MVCAKGFGRRLYRLVTPCSDVVAETSVRVHFSPDPLLPAGQYV